MQLSVCLAPISNRIPTFIFFLQAVKKIASRYSGCGIRSASFQENILTVGTGLGMLMFYDVRAGKYLESSINSSRTVVLKASKGYVVCVEKTTFFTNIFFAILIEFTLEFVYSFPRRMSMDFNKSNMSQLFIRTATIAVGHVYLRPVAPCQQH